MGKTLATRQELRQEFQLLRQEMASGFELLGHKTDRLCSDMSRDLAANRQSIIIQLGSVILVCFALTLAAMRCWI